MPCLCPGSRSTSGAVAASAEGRPERYRTSAVPWERDGMQASGQGRAGAWAGGRGAEIRRGHRPPPPAPARAGSAQVTRRQNQAGPAPPGTHRGPPSSPRRFPATLRVEKESHARTCQEPSEPRLADRGHRADRSRQNPDWLTVATGLTWAPGCRSRTALGHAGDQACSAEGKRPGPEGQVLCDSLPRGPQRRRSRRDRT